MFDIYPYNKGSAIPFFCLFREQIVNFCAILSFNFELYCHFGAKVDFITLESWIFEYYSQFVCNFCDKSATCIWNNN